MYINTRGRKQSSAEPEPLSQSDNFAMGHGLEVGRHCLILGKQLAYILLFWESKLEIKKFLESELAGEDEYTFAYQFLCYL